MKKLLLLSLSAVLCFSGTAQQTTTRSSLTKDDYLRKSKHEVITGLVFVGSGIVLIAAAAATYKAGPGSLVLLGAGLLTGIASIPFFVAAAVNKHQANTMTFRFETQNSSYIVKGGIRNTEYPALSLKIPLH